MDVPEVGVRTPSQCMQNAPKVRSHICSTEDRPSQGPPATPPIVFYEHYPTSIIIIDCSYIFLACPTNLLGRAQTVSS